MSLDYTVLGVVMDEPTHGYSIKKTLLEIFASSLGVNDGQLYPALARLEARGWIEKQVVEQRRSPTKHLYRVTAAGKEAFFRWLATPEPEGPPARYDFFWKDSFLQKCGFFRHLEPRDVALHCRRMLEAVEPRIEALEATLKRGARETADPYRRMIVEYGIRYERMRREWLRDLLGRAMRGAGWDERALGV
ncbi:MAG: PadR family transcriptional regulator [Myxococcota bacterium]